MKKTFIVTAMVLLSVLNLMAQKQGSGNVSGIIIEKSSNKPLEFATVLIRSYTDSTFNQGTVTGKKGEFTFNNLVFGAYKLIYSLIGFEKVETPVFYLNAEKFSYNPGKLHITDSTATVMNVPFTALPRTFALSNEPMTINLVEDVLI